jgi:DNA (cytosine-5)-methyltransferase 1
MNHGSLFSGIGGFDLAAQWSGWTNKFHCEWNPFGQKVLKHYWPEAESYSDITKTDFTLWRGKIDILTGGFPCQPYSQAGKRLGKEDDRHLWPEMLRAIREIQPRYVVGENVSGLVNWNGGMVFNEVQAELEAEGYEVTPFILPACAVNAPHRRDRIWFVAYSESRRSGRIRDQSEEAGTPESNQSFGGIHRVSNASNTNSTGRWQGNKKNEIKPSEQSYGSSISGNNSNTSRIGLQRSKYFGSTRETGKESLDKQSGRSFCSEWKEFPTQSPICIGNDGFSSQLDGITFSKWRNESIKAGGNAIVPQVAYQIFQAIEKYENLTPILQ